LHNKIIGLPLGRLAPSMISAYLLRYWISKKTGTHKWTVATCRLID